MDDKIRVHVFISGRVQGVFFRQNTKNKAKSLGVAGWIKNLSDGRVEAIFEGEKDKIEELIGWAKRGPMFSRIDGVEVIKEGYQGEFKDFEIMRG